jgi:hypothetical protein
MCLERAHRLDAETSRLTDAVDTELPCREVPGKSTEVERMLQRLEAPAPWRRHARDPAEPGRRTLSAGERAVRLDFEDYRVLGLRDVLQRLESDAVLRGAVLAAADRTIARRAMRSASVPSNASGPAGLAVWRAAERHAVTLYRHAAEAGEVDQDDPSVAAALSQRGGGQSLPAELRRELEAELGLSLARVRVHTDPVAAQAARAVRADAFTVGEDIFFAEGAFAPETPAGRRLVVHELAHVAQALCGRAESPRSGTRVSQPGESLEHEAEALAERVARNLGRRREPGSSAGDPLGSRALEAHLGDQHLPVQRKGGADPDSEHPHAAAQAGVVGGGGSLPFVEQIQASFGTHDVRDVGAHVGGAATTACAEIGASAYAIGNQVAFAAAPDLYTAAHEAAHVVQQRRGVHLEGGVGEVGDPYERHADAVAELVVQGQSAQTALDELAPTGGGTRTAVQRYLAVDLKGAIEPTTYAARAQSQARGYNGFNDSNHGWVEVTKTDNTVELFQHYSLFDTAHSEEKLLKEVFVKYPDILATKPAPNAVGCNRITRIYTERQPCDLGTAELARKKRADTQSNCHAYLTHVLHPDVPVIFSVANNPTAHSGLKDRQRQQYWHEIVNNTRRLTLTEAHSCSNLGNYQAPIRQLNHNINGDWGRNYLEDLAKYNHLLKLYDAKVQFLATVGVAEPWDRSRLEARLRAAFEGGAHAAGSDPVLAAMQAAYDEERQPLDTKLAEIIAEFEDEPDDSSKKRGGDDDDDDDEHGDNATAAI